MLPKWLRIILFIISPMMLVVYAIVLQFSYSGYKNYSIGTRMVNPQVIENITSVNMPQYKVVEKDRNTPLIFMCTFHSLYSCSFSLEFDEIPDTTFYQTLQQNNFRKLDGRYFFNVDYYDERNEEEYGLRINIMENKKTFTIDIYNRSI
jgi:hypothetical protein